MSNVRSLPGTPENGPGNGRAGALAWLGEEFPEFEFWVGCWSQEFCAIVAGHLMHSPGAVDLADRIRAGLRVPRNAIGRYAPVAL